MAKRKPAQIISTAEPKAQLSTGPLTMAEKLAGRHADHDLLHDNHAIPTGDVWTLPDGSQVRIVGGVFRVG
jgi:hypothetical protein